MSIEEQLFSWKGWDQDSTASFQFYDTELKQPIGQFEVGTKFPVININYESAKLSIWYMGNESGTPDVQFAISLNVHSEILVCLA